MAVSHIRLRNAVTGAEWDCPAGAVPHWRARGWQPAEETSVVPSSDEAAPVDGDNESARKGRHPKGSK